MLLVQVFVLVFSSGYFQTIQLPQGQKKKSEIKGNVCWLWVLTEQVYTQKSFYHITTGLSGLYRELQSRKSSSHSLAKHQRSADLNLTSQDINLTVLWEATAYLINTLVSSFELLKYEFQPTSCFTAIAPIKTPISKPKKNIGGPQTPKTRGLVFFWHALHFCQHRKDIPDFQSKIHLTEDCHEE